jgi:hypothetical protein
MSNIPKTDSEAMTLFAEMAMSVESATERERVALALVVGVYYGQAKQVLTSSGLTDSQPAMVRAAYSEALSKTRGVLERVGSGGGA